MQKGFAHLLLIIPLILALGGGAAYLAFTNKSEPQAQPNINKTPVIDKIPKEEKKTEDPILNLIKPSVDEPEAKVYKNTKLSFEFKYPSSLEVIEDTEEDYNKRGNGNFRKNFTSYVGYEPGKLLGAIVVLNNEKNYDNAPLTLWVFENPDNLSVDAWYEKYWYFPFVWGDFTSSGKAKTAPDKELTISGQIAKSAIIEYQPKKPRLIYLSKDSRMYLFRVLSNQDLILSSFKFLNQSDESTNNNYVCPQWEWVNCMPTIGENGPIPGGAMCKQDYLIWARENCPGFKGAAY